jgi:hypothetical protein
VDSFCSSDRIAATSSCENGRVRKDGNPIDNVRICDVEDIKKVVSTAVGEL